MNGALCWIAYICAANWVLIGWIAEFLNLLRDAIFRIVWAKNRSGNTLKSTSHSCIGTDSKCGPTDSYTYIGSCTGSGVISGDQR